jgi:hypothetical protein
MKGDKIVKTDDLTQKAEKALKDCVQSAPFVQIASLEREEDKGDLRLDFAFRINIPDSEKIIYGELKNSGQPRYARQAINQLLLYTQKLPESYGVFVAPYISPASAQMCKEAGIGYVDFAGNCFVSFDRVFISIEGKPNPFPQSRDLRTIFSPKASRIIRVLLNDPFTVWKVDELSKKAGVSLGLVAGVKKILLDREWIAERHVGFVLMKPKDLLQEWSSQYFYRRSRVLDFYSLKDESTIESELREYCTKKNIRFALTLFSGASRVAPYTRFKRVFAFVESVTEEMQNTLGLKTVTTGPNVTLLEPYDQGVFYGTANYSQMPVVSPIQLYLDLYSYKGRGEEAAQFLYEQVIESIWSQKSTTDKKR